VVLNITLQLLLPPVHLQSRRYTQSGSGVNIHRMLLICVTTAPTTDQLILQNKRSNVT